MGACPLIKRTKGNKCGSKYFVLCRFEVKKWNAVALWAWDIVVDNCAICRFDRIKLLLVLFGEKLPLPHITTLFSSIQDDGQEPHHGPLHRVSSQPTYYTNIYQYQYHTNIYYANLSGTTSWTFALSVKPTRLRPPVRSALWLGECKSQPENLFCLKIHALTSCQGGLQV